MLKSESQKYTALLESDFLDYACVAGPTAARKEIDWSFLYSDIIPPNSPVWVFENGDLVAQSAACAAVATLEAKALSELAGQGVHSPEWLTTCADAALSQQAGGWHWRMTAAGETPLVMLHFYTGQDSKQAVFTRHLIEISPHQQVTLIEVHGDLHPEASLGLRYGQVNIQVGAGAALQHHRLSLASAGMTSWTDVVARVDTHAAYDLRTVLSGGKQHRDNIKVGLAEDGASLNIRCLHWASGQTRLDTHLDVQHLANAGESAVIIRGVAAQQSASSVTGKILIPAGTRDNRAQLENKNVLLSKEATINSRPQLEIQSEDIQQCTHGATVGCLDSEALFYLQSRGITLTEAKQMLIDSFISPILGAFSSDFVDALRAQLFADVKVA